MFQIENIVYLRKLNAQELGYRKGELLKAGRYILVSKYAIRKQFFSHLSEVTLNDHITLNIVPPFSDDVVLTKCVYHNDKKIVKGGSRDEYRLYLNTKNDMNRDYFKPDDIVALIRMRDQTREQDANDNLVYKVLRYTLEDRDYARLDSLMKNTSLSSSSDRHALVEIRTLNFLDKLRKIQVGKRIIPQEIIDDALLEPVKQISLPGYDENDTTKWIRSRSFRDMVMYFYEGRCAITNRDFLVEHWLFNNLEAAHIYARAAGGGSHPSNGIALERNLHWAFDRGFFTLTEDYKVDVHPEAMRIPYLQGIHKQSILLPQDNRTWPDKEAIKWHRENVLGRFLQTEAKER